MLMMPSNFMLLDEPTNHLDMRAKDVLLRALQDYSGTVVFVSHDRYFIDKLATRVIEVENGNVHSFPGNYEDYVWRKQGGPEKLTVGGKTVEPETERPAVQTPQPVAVKVAAEPRPQDGARRLNPIKLRQMKERRRAIEDEVTRLEVEIADFEHALASFRSAEETQQITQLLSARRTDLEHLLAEWENVAQTIEANR